MRRTVFLACLTIAALVAAVTPASAGKAFPETIALPDGFQPEGIAVGRGTTFYVGSIPTGAIYRGDLRTGRGAVLVPAKPGRAAIGVDEDRGRLFVAGGSTGHAFVYDTRTGAELADYQLNDGSGTFVNDVVVTRTAAWLTDSARPVIYRVPLGAGGRPGPQAGVRTVPLTGDYVHTAGFNANGIDATPNGRTLVIVQSNTGKLFTVDTAGRTREIGLGGATVRNGDGILLDGKTLYVVQNRDNRIAVIALAASLRSGRIVSTITDPDFDVPTTVDELGRRLYAVNARFGTSPTPTTDYGVVQVRKPAGR